MSLAGWRETTIRVLAEQVGPVAELLVNDALRKLGGAEDEMVATRFLRFLECLHQELPAELDRKALCVRVRDRVLKHETAG